MADTFGNISTAQRRFLRAAAPGEDRPAGGPPDAGWVSGVIYDSSTCDVYQTTCQGLAGVRVTLDKVDTDALQRACVARKQLIAAKLAAKGTRLPAAGARCHRGHHHAGYRHRGHRAGRLLRLPGGADRPLLAAREKDGYTYGQREAEIVKERSTATNAIYVTPMDTAVTPCGPAGCSHTSADGQMQVAVPAGAIPAGDQVSVTATEFDQVEFLPSGALPEGTWETYAFNLGGDSDYRVPAAGHGAHQEQQGLRPRHGDPLGFWNQQMMQWEHEGIAWWIRRGEWVVMQLQHFSNHDPNFPTSQGNLNGEGEDETEDKADSCSVNGDSSVCTIDYRSGVLSEEVGLPPVQVLNESMAPSLVYNTQRGIRIP